MRGPKLGPVLSFQATATADGWETVVFHRAGGGGICPVTTTIKDAGRLLVHINRIIKKHGVER